MLHRSSGGTGKSEPTDLNALIKEYVNLAFHGMRSGKNPINVSIDFDLDESTGKANGGATFCIGLPAETAR